MTREQKPTFCRICEPLCGMIATVEDGRLVALRPDKDHPLSAGFACQKGIAFTEVVNDPDRVTTPLRRGLNGFEPVTWDEAMTDIADRLADIHRRHGSRAIGWYYGNPGAFSDSHTLSLSMFMAGFGPRLHVFTAGSQDVNNRFVRQRRKPRVVGAQRKRARGGAGEAGAERRHRPLRQRDAGAL
jgi:anaerobic selenocysteine-containing dehydrogenase